MYFTIKKYQKAKKWNKRDCDCKKKKKFSVLKSTLILHKKFKIFF